MLFIHQVKAFKSHGKNCNVNSSIQLEFNIAKLKKKCLLSEKNICILCKIVIGQDPCVEGNFVELDHVSKRSPSFAADSAPLCDRYITEEWYRAKSHVMSTSPPTLGKCGTLYPVWLRGSPVSS